MDCVFNTPPPHRLTRTPPTCVIVLAAGTCTRARVTVSLGTSLTVDALDASEVSECSLKQQFSISYLIANTDHFVMRCAAEIYVSKAAV